MFSHDSWIDFVDLSNALMCLVSVALRGTPAKIWPILSSRFVELESIDKRGKNDDLGNQTRAQYWSDEVPGGWKRENWWTRERLLM